MRTLRWSLALALLTIAAPAWAVASTTSVDGTSLRYDAGEGEVNVVTFTLQMGKYTLQDAGVETMSYGEPCTQWPLDKGTGAGAFCPAAGVERMVALLGSDGDSWSTGVMGAVPIPVDLHGEAGNDTLQGSGYADVITGGSGEDTLEGEAGADTIDARDGAADTIRCGDGVDKVGADPVDDVAADCEQRLDGAPIQPPKGGPNPGPTQPFESALMAPGRWNAHRWRNLGFAISCSRACGVEAKVLRRGRVIAVDRDWLRPTTSLVAPRMFVPVSKRHRAQLWRARPATVTLSVSIVDLTDPDAAPVTFKGRVKVRR